MFKSLREELLDLEEATLGVDSEELTVNDALEIANNEAEARDLETNIENSISNFNQAQEIITDTESAIVALQADLESMDSIAIGKALGAIERNAEQVCVSGFDKIDSEAITPENMKSSVDSELEEIKESLAKAWKAVKEFFLSIASKVSELLKKLKNWMNDKSKKIAGVIKKLESKQDKPKEGVEVKKFYGKVGSKLAMFTMVANKFNIAELASMSKEVLDTGKETEIDKKVHDLIKSGKFKSNVNVPADGKVKVTRIDGATVKFAVIDKNGKYESYGVSTMPKSEVAKLDRAAIDNIYNGKVTIAQMTDALKAAAAFGKRLEKLSDTIDKDIAATKKEVSTSIENAKVGGLLTFAFNLVNGADTTIERLEQKEKVALLRKKSTLVANSGKDLILGGHSLISEFISVAMVAISILADKDAKKEETKTEETK